MNAAETRRAVGDTELTKSPDLLPLIFPGEILLEDFMKPLGVSIEKPASDIDVPLAKISAICNGKRAISADTALRMGRYFGTSPEVWTGLQSDYELRRAKRKVGALIEERVQPLRAA